MLAVASVPPVYTTSQLDEGILCVFSTGKAWLWWGILFLCWKETGLVFQSPKVPSKRVSSLMRSCSNFFEDWRLDDCNCVWQMTGDLLFLFLVSSFCVAHLVATCVLIGSLAKLSFSFCTRSVLALFCRLLMLSLAKWLHQWLLSWLLKSIAIPHFFMVLHQERGHIVAYYPCCTQPHQVLTQTFCYQSLVVLNRVRFWLESFAIRVFLYSTTSGSEEDLLLSK
jgi:hypothetical protein